MTRPDDITTTSEGLLTRGRKQFKCKSLEVRLGHAEQPAS